jgi:membrane associated rhomboid family serine protease
MLPVRDVIPNRTTPLVVIAIAIGSAAGVVYAQTLSHAALRAWLLDVGLHGSGGVTSAIVTAPFLHRSLWEGAANLLALWIFGPTIEDRTGHLRFLAFYLAAGVGGALAALWLQPPMAPPSAGAPASIAGVIAGYLALFPRSRVLVLIPWPEWDAVEVPATFMAATWLLLQALGGIGTGGGPMAMPLGGAAVGVALVWLVRRPERQRVEWWAP